MSISSHSFININDQQNCYFIDSNQRLDASISEAIRAEIKNCLNQDFPVIYLNATDVEEIDLSGINEIIHSHYTLQKAFKKLIFVYTKNSKVEKWVETVGLDKFIETAIVL